MTCSFLFVFSRRDVSCHSGSINPTTRYERMLQGLLGILGGVLLILNSLLDDICFDEVRLLTPLLSLLMCLELRCVF
jgi:hypothetical protein